MMPDLHQIGEPPNTRLLTLGQAPDSQKKLVLRGVEFAGACLFFAELQELAQLAAEPSQRPVIIIGHTIS